MSALIIDVPAAITRVACGRILSAVRARIRAGGGKGEGEGGGDTQEGRSGSIRSVRI